MTSHRNDVSSNDVSSKNSKQADWKALTGTMVKKRKLDLLEVQAKFAGGLGPRTPSGGSRGLSPLDERKEKLNYMKNKANLVMKTFWLKLYRFCVVLAQEKSMLSDFEGGRS